MTISLQHAENYKRELENTTTEIFVMYMGIVQEFLVQCMDSIFITDVSYYRYIIIKGIETIAHVFRNLLLYTNNLNITYHHSQKAFYYYVEFIGQIGEESHSFLQLNSKDATLFVYKKTIFDIKKDFSSHHKGDTTETTQFIIDNVAMLTGIYNRCLESIFCSEQWNTETCKNMLKLVDNRMCKFTQNILNANGNANGNEHAYNNVIKMVEQVHRKNAEYGIELIPILEVFTRKIKGKNITKEYLRTRLSHEEHDTSIQELTPLRYVNWLLAEI
tara:strand:- start:1154 stop:1975 length:822 start_codon:yes stop_codon:yes gene_type:complete